MYRHLISVALCLVALASPAAAATPFTVISEVLLIRHGVRPPTHEPALPIAIAPDAWPAWPVADGFLTPHGAAAIRLLAAYDRQTLAAAGLLTAAGCPQNVEIYTDVDERTVATGGAFADGLAPGCHLVVGHGTGKTDPLFSALDQPGSGLDPKAAKAAMLAASGGSIAILIKTHAGLFDAMQAALDPAGHAFRDIPSGLTAKTPGRMPKLSSPLEAGSSAGEDFLLEYLEGMSPAQIGWGRVSASQVALLLALHPLAYTITARPAYIADRSAGPIAARIVAGLAVDHRFTVLVGHDTNEAELAGLLDLHWSLGGYPEDDPPPGGALVFVLSRDNVSGQKYVTVFYQTQTMEQIRHLTPLGIQAPPALQALPVPGCGNSATATACTLAGFTDLVNSKRVKDLQPG